MALKHNDEYYTKFTFEENGRSFTRRIHVLDMQDAWGVSHKLEGKGMPNTFILKTGKEHKGRHLAELLLNPESCKKPPYVAPPPPQPFPQLRDLGNMLIGIVTFLLGSWSYAVISSCF